MNLKKIIIKIIPNILFPFIKSFFGVFADIHFKQKIKKLRFKQTNLIKVIRLKDKIDVIFLVIHDSIWKYEEVYKLLDNDSKFNVIVVVIPLVRNNICDMETYYQSLEFFNNKKYNTLGAYDEDKKLWLDVKKLINPDVVFFTNPHNLTFDKYYINNYFDSLTCYVPYAFVVIKDIEIHYKKNFHQLLWRLFLETDRHREFYEEFSLLDSTNALVSGYPGLDVKKSLNFCPKNIWLKCRKKRKKIIWAPHHTIQSHNGTLNYSSFEEYHEYFIELCKTNQDIQVAFKPHPLLRENLNNAENWGKARTDNYYNKWNELDNGQFENGAYIDLFEKSDAMITDSASFIAEYLYFDKPILFTLKDSNVINRFNSFGQKIFNVLYQSNTLNDTNNFINNQVVLNNDNLKEVRNIFLNNEILPQNGNEASQNIFLELKKQLC